MQLQAGKKINDIATVSDEAFVLLILQNIWDDMMEVEINDYYRPKKRKKNSEAHGNSKNKEDTNMINDNNETDHARVITGCWTNAWRGSQRYGGWSPEGLNQFNKLVAMVQHDRETDMHFQAQYKIWLKESIADKTRKKQKKQ